jgi:nucleoside-diphosphate-sugar epimerase
MNDFSGRHLVILGCGYVGMAVAAVAAGRGARVTALTRNPATAAELGARGIATVVADLADDGWHRRIDGPADFVLNCVSSGGGGLEGYRRSYVDGMAATAAWTRRIGFAGTIVYTSSTSVYPQDGGVVVDEDAPTAPAGAGDRAALLLEAETRLRAAVCGRWFVLRLAGIYGPGRSHLVDQVRAGEVSGAGGHRLNLIHRDDIVAAVMAAFGAPPECRNQVFNVADDAPARKADVAAWLAERLGVAVPRFTGAPVAGRRAITPDRIISNARLKGALGWAPRHPSFREGLASLLSR